MMLVLCGYMGSGKSLIGRKLADKLQTDFLDLDEEIATDQKMSISEIFQQKGEIYFRKTEMKVLQKTLSASTDGVLALGGGTPCYGNNLELIKQNPHTELIYLKMNLESLTERLFKERDQRPLIKDFDQPEQLEDYIRKHLFERQFYYLQSDIKVEATHASPAEIVQNILEKVKS